MGTQKVVDLLGAELRQLGHGDVKLTGRGGTWTTPAAVEFEVQGERNHSIYWEGSHPDEKMAESLLIDVLASIWKLPADQTRSRLSHIREQKSAALR